MILFYYKFLKGGIDVSSHVSISSFIHRATNMQYPTLHQQNNYVKRDPRKSLIFLEQDVLKGFQYLFDTGSTEALINALYSTKFHKRSTKIKAPFRYSDLEYKIFTLHIKLEFTEHKQKISISVIAYYRQDEKQKKCVVFKDPDLHDDLMWLREQLLLVQKTYEEL